MQAGDTGSRGHGRLGNCHQFRKQRHTLSCRGVAWKKISSTGGRPSDVRRCECAATARTSLRVRPKGSPHVRRLTLVSGPRLQRLVGTVDGAAAATMSGKKAAEKVSEIDAHISKQYDIVRRLGKGVIMLYPPVYTLPSCPGKFMGWRAIVNLPLSPCENKMRGLM